MTKRGYRVQQSRSDGQWGQVWIDGTTDTHNGSAHPYSRCGHPTPGTAALTEASVNAGARSMGPLLILGFVAIGVITGSSVALGGVSSLIAPAAVLLIGTSLLARRTWTDPSRTRGVGGFAGVLSAVLLTGSWAAALGAEASGWSGSSPLWMFTLMWAAALAAGWLELRRMSALAGASTALVVLAAFGAAGGSDAASVFGAGFTAPAFMPLVMLAGFGLLVSSIVDLARNVDELYRRADMSSLAATLGGGTALSLAAVILTSTSSFAAADVPAQRLRFTLVALAVLVAVGAALIGVGARLARRGSVSPTAGLPLALGLVAAACGGWFAFSAQGLAAVPALLFVLIAALFAVGTGLAFAAAVVRDGHVLRARFEKARAARSRAAEPGAVVTEHSTAGDLGTAGAA